MRNDLNLFTVCDYIYCHYTCAASSQWCWSYLLFGTRYAVPRENRTHSVILAWTVLEFLCFHRVIYPVFRSDGLQCDMQGGPRSLSSARNAVSISKSNHVWRPVTLRWHVRGEYGRCNTCSVRILAGTAGSKTMNGPNLDTLQWQTFWILVYESFVMLFVSIHDCRFIIHWIMFFHISWGKCNLLVSANGVRAYLWIGWNLC